MYASPSTPDLLHREEVISLFEDAIDVSTYLEIFEHEEIEKYGYCKELRKKFSPNSEDSKSTIKKKEESDEDDDKIIEEVKEKKVKKFDINFSIPTETVSEEEEEEQKQEEDTTKYKKLDYTDFIKRIIVSIEKTIFMDETSVSINEFVEWCESNCQFVSQFLKCLLLLKMVRPLTKNASDMEKHRYQPMTPNPKYNLLEDSSINSKTLLWAVESFIEPNRNWKVIYNGQLHGRSLNRFSFHVVGYGGPTLLFIVTKKKDLIGAFMGGIWQDSSKYIGTNENFLFSLTPQVKKLLPTGMKENYAYFFSNKKSYGNYPVGIGFGGELKQFRFWIDEHLENGYIRSSDVTYESGALLDSPSFEILHIEVWGCRSVEAEHALEREHFLRNKEYQRSNNLRGSKGGWSSGADKFIMDLIGRTGTSDGYYDEVQKVLKDKKKGKD